MIKTLILAAAASTLMAGAALAQEQNVSPDRAQSPTSPLTVNPLPAGHPPIPARSADTAPTGTQSDISATAGAATGATSGVPGGVSGSLTIETVTNGPVPDTAANRAKYGVPDSRAGKMTAARGN